MLISMGSRIASLARPTKSKACYQGAVTATAGQTFAIETSPAGEELLSITVPAGKVYTFGVRVEYKVSDA